MEWCQWWDYIVGVVNQSNSRNWVDYSLMYVVNRNESFDSS